MNSPSVVKRFSATLAANVFGAACSFTATLLIAREIGPSSFGHYSFLLASFTAINSVLDLGTSTAYYTFASRGRDGLAHLRLYGSSLSLRAVVMAALLLLLPQRVFDIVWLGHARTIVLLAMAGYFLFVPVRTFLVQTAESVRRTFFIQAALAAAAALQLGVIAVLVRTHNASLPLLFGTLIATNAALAAAFFLGFPWRDLKSNGEADYRALCRQYIAYCGPLAINTLAVFPCEFLDRWLIQALGGSVQQGYYALSERFAAVALLATSALLNIFWKEIAAAHEAGDAARVRELYERATGTLFLAAAGAAAFLAPHAPFLIVRLAGPDFAPAWMALTLMLFYPAFQTLGQLNAAYFYATNATRLHTAINIAAMFAGTALSYLVLAPRDAAVPGLGLGASGVAVRMVTLQSIVITVQGWCAARRQGAAPAPWAPFGVTLALCGIGFAAKAAASPLAGLLPGSAGLWNLALSAPLYAAGVLGLVRLWPRRTVDLALQERLLRAVRSFAQSAAA